MACYHPAKAVRLQNGNVKFVSQATVDGSLMTLPCGQCIGCRLERSRQWAIRCLDEAQMYKDNSFLTLTMSQDSVKKFGRSLDVSLFQKFMKRVRKEVAPLRIRFFHCGEYTQAFNPHYHALMFGLGFSDRKYWCKSKSGENVYVSEMLGRLWPHGYSYIGDVTFKSAAYVARYALKKIGDWKDLERLVMKDTGEVLNPEYVTMSRGGRGGLGGIGRPWYEKFKDDVYPIGNRVVRGHDMRPPRFYDALYAVEDPLGFEDLQFRRENSFDKLDNVEYRLVAKEKVTLARLKAFPRD